MSGKFGDESSHVANIRGKKCTVVLLLHSFDESKASDAAIEKE